MSKASPGTGDERKKVIELGKSLEAAAEAYKLYVMSDESKIRNNMDTPSSEEQLHILRNVGNISNNCTKVMEAAYDHHKRQTSVLPNNIFGQRRRIKADNTVDIIDPIDPTKMAARLNQDGFQMMSPTQQASYMARGMSPHVSFRDWDPATQISYLKGEWSPDTEDRTSQNPGSPAVVESAP